MSLEVGAEVGEALDGGAPLVALESTLISHGLPHPQNLQVAALAQVDELRVHLRRVTDPDSLAEMKSNAEVPGFR